MSNPLSEAFDYLRDSIKNIPINSYQSAYINPEVGTITDVFGSFKVLPNSATNWNRRREAPSWRCFSIRPEAKDAYIDCLPTAAFYINLRNNQMNNIVRLTPNVNLIYTTGIGSSGGSVCVGMIVLPSTLILPKTFYGRLDIISNYDVFTRGLYLNSYGDNVVNKETWITHQSTASAEYTATQSVVDFDSGYNMSPMYLNRLYLSTQTFANLAIKLGTVTGGKLYLGTKNTDRMTTAQKDAITAKGWTIY